MSTPVSSYSVTPNTGAAVTIAAQSFSVTSIGALVLCSDTSQTVAAFAAGAWVSVTPVVTP